MAQSDEERLPSGDGSCASSGDGSAGSPRDAAPGADSHSPGPQRHLSRCWQLDCDIDPLILRVRLLRQRGAWGLALCLEEELLPLF